MFLIRYTDTDGAMQILRLDPKPTEVEYPEGSLYTTRTTRDGNVIIQRPMRDARQRKWVWRGYRPTMTAYEAQWAVLEGMSAKKRWEQGHANPTVEIWEGATGSGGFGDTTDGLAPDLVNYSNLKWTRVRIAQVTRQNRGGGGVAVYDSSTVGFFIDDPDYTAF